MNAVRVRLLFCQGMTLLEDINAIYFAGLYRMKPDVSAKICVCVCVFVCGGDVFG
jgi:hypothetical protein